MIQQYYKNLYLKTIIRIYLFFDFYKGVFVVCARVGASTTSLLASHFAKRNTKFGGGGKKRKNTMPRRFAPRQHLTISQKVQSGGEGEIRTHDPLRDAAFQVRWNKPGYPTSPYLYFLSQLSSR